MPDKSILLDRQERMFRVACDPKRYALSLKLIAIDSGLHYDSVRDYAAGKTIMPITALDALVGVIPDELLSLLFSGNRAIVQVPEQIDHDELEKALLDLLATKAAAHHPESECGREIGPNERAALDAKVVHLPIVKAA